MKKAKMICATVLSILLMICLVFPAFAEFDDTDKVDVVDTSKWTVNVNKNAPLSVDQTQPIHEMVEQIFPEYADLVDYDTIGSSSRNDQSMTSMQAKHIPEIRIPSVSAVRGLMSTAIVYTETELEDALDNSTITIILLACDIALTQSHEIDHSVVIMALSGTKTITAASGYNHFEVNNQSTNIDITFGNVILDGDDVGGGIYILDSYVTINNPVIQNCNSSSSGTIFASNIKWNSNVGHLVHTGHVTINGGELTDNAASNGAITVAGSLDVNGTDINHNQGRGITVLNISSQIAYVNLSNVTITNNASTGAGGGVYLFATVTEITGINDYSEISNNTSTGAGGGIYSNLSKLLISHSKINGNKAVGDSGGGIYSVGKLDLTDVEVKNNETDVASGYGAGIYARNVGGPGSSIQYTDNDEYVTISGCTINGNRGYHTVNEVEEESAVYGGGLMIHDILASISNTSITENTANIGGGICALYDDDSNLPEANRADIALSNVTVNGNTAHENGGGVILYGDDLSTVTNPAYACRRLSISGGSINTNSSCIGGGLMVVDAEATCDGGLTIQSNTADSTLHSFGSSNPWNWNSAGAGILLYNSDLTLSNASITLNQLSTPTGYKTAGAGIYAKGESSILLSNAHTKVNNNTGAGYGGGIYTEVDSSLTISNGEVKSNSARYGGGIETYGGLSMSGGAITDNISISTGGGVLAQKNSANTVSVVISGGSVSGNHGANGAGIYSTAPITMSGGTIQNNTSTGIGGGIYTTAALTITAGSILGNSANTYGGGINATNSAVIGTSQGLDGNTLIQGNSASNGAGFAARGAAATYTIYSGTISGNTATTNGGGIYCVGTLNIQNGIISGNSAVNGAGVYVSKNMSLANGTIKGNNASANGGGIYLPTAGSLTMTGGIIGDITGRTVWPNNEGNTAINGAGIYSSGTISLSGGKIIANRASETNGLGGGVYNAGTMTMSGGSVELNNAVNGGGIYLTGTLLMSGGVIGKIYDDTLQNGIESSNTATNGAGIYVTGTANLTGGSISQNVAEEYGGGLYIDSTGSVTNSGCDIIYNFAGLGGGGAYVALGSSYTEVNPPQPDGYCHDNEIDDILDENE